MGTFGLLLANAQSDLTPLERGRHALMATTKWHRKRNNGEKDEKASIAAYAASTGALDETVRRQICAYEVFAESHHVVGLEYFRHLVVIHAAPRDKWAELAQKMVERLIFALRRSN
jgi:hypothetical protein